MSKLTDRLAEVLGIYNETDFARKGEAVIWIRYSVHHAHAIGYSDNRAIVQVLVGGTWKKKEFRESGKTPVEVRRNCVEAAQAWVKERTGRDLEWIAGPYRDSWMPRDVRERVMAELKAAESASG